MPTSFAALDLEPRGVAIGVWTRRAILTVMALFVLAALLNRFGQRPADSVATANGATLRLSAPERVRGGIFFQSRIDVQAIQRIDHPRLVLDHGWFEGMQINSIEPQPVGETSRDGRVVLSYDTLQTGDFMRVWFQFEVNPTNVGHRPYAVELDDAEQPLVRVRPSIRSLP
jgi:hypothetical protein